MKRILDCLVGTAVAVILTALGVGFTVWLFVMPASADRYRDVYRPLTSYSLSVVPYPGTISTLTVGSSTGGQTNRVRLLCTDNPCFVAFPVTDGTAAAQQNATEPVYLHNNREEYFTVTSGHYILVGATGGTLYITEVE